MKFELFKDIIIKNALNDGFDECEVYYVEGENLKISIYESEVDNYSLEKYKGVCFRGNINNKMGYSYSEILDFESINMLIKRAKENATYIESDDIEFIYEGDKNYETLDTYNEELEDKDPQFFIDLALELESETKKQSDKVHNIDTCNVIYKSYKKSIYNSKGLDVTKSQNHVVAYVIPVVKENSTKVDAIGYVTTKNLDNLNIKEIAKESVENAINKLNAKTVDSKNYKIIMKNNAMADLLETFAQVFNADIAQKKMSLLKDKENHKIGSDILTIIDNPHLEDGISSTAFDDEGVKTYKKEIVSRGILKTLLYNLKTAKKVDKKSTGNGFKGNFKSSLQVDCTNLYIEKGENSLQQLLEYVGEGIMITELEGLHSGANPISGDFSLAAKGFYIDNSKISHPIEQITVAGNFFDVLNNIEMIGYDIAFPLSNVGSPSVAINKLSIAGK